MSGKHFVGADYGDFTNSGLSAPVSRVTMMIDTETALTAGDDSGAEMKSECPFATQEMVEALLARVRGYRFQMFSAEAARLDPTAELGDAVDIGGVHAIISHRSDDGSMFPDISAVGEAELEDEYPTEGPLTREFSQKIAQTRSQIKKASDEINLRVEELGKSTAEDLEKYAESVTKSLGELQSQIDGNIMTWFYDYEPTTKNEPASLWTSEDEKIKHLGDVFYVVDNEEKGGQAYRWEYVGGAYRWSLIEDVEVAKALADAAKAQDTADKKRRVFTFTPTPPYEVGDLWTQGPNGDLMRCNTARASGSFVEGDWGLASKYTDDSALNTFLTGQYKTDLDGIKEQADQKAETWYQANNPADAWTTDALKAEHTGDMWYCTGAGDATHYQKSWRWSGSTWEEMKTTPPQAVFDQIDGKAQIFIAEPKTPYRKGDLWFNSATSDIMTCISDRLSGSYSSGDWQKRDKYTDDSALNTFLTGQYKTDIDNIKTQADQKAETWYQANNPADAWTTDTLKAEHKGDMWYCTGSGDTTHYQKFWRWSGSGWQEMTSTPPEAVFDRIDGKAQIYIAQPTPPYHRGDLWFDSTTSDILTCIKDRLSGNYDAGDWEKRNKYTDDSYAKDKYSELDLKIGSITLEVANGETKSSLTLKVGETVLASADIVLSGVVTFEGLKSGETVIDGGWVNTKNLNLANKLTFDDFDEDTRNSIVRSSNFKTYLDDELVKSPKIAGGQFMNPEQTAWVKISSYRGMAGLSLESDHWSDLDPEGSSVFAVYDADAGNVSFFAKGYQFMMATSGVTGIVQPFGKWDFSAATVTGIGSSAADYVTAQGTQYGWTYRKWNSGVAECWRTETASNVAVTYPWGSVYTSNAATFKGQSYPFSFAEAPNVLVSPENTGGADWWVVTQAKGTAYASPGYQVCRGTQFSNMTCTAHFYVVGRWK